MLEQHRPLGSFFKGDPVRDIVQAASSANIFSDCHLAEVVQTGGSSGRAVLSAAAASPMQHAPTDVSRDERGMADRGSRRIPKISGTASPLNYQLIIHCSDSTFGVINWFLF